VHNAPLTMRSCCWVPCTCWTPTRSFVSSTVPTRPPLPLQRPPPSPASVAVPGPGSCRAAPALSPHPAASHHHPPLQLPAPRPPVCPGGGGGTGSHPRGAPRPPGGHAPLTMGREGGRGQRQVRRVVTQQGWLVGSMQCCGLPTTAAHTHGPHLLQY
jgi:hypothetical protein